MLWGLLALVGVLILVLARMEPRAGQAEPEEDKAVLVRVMEVEPRTVVETATLPGRVAAHVSARLSVEKAGRVVELAADKGDAVKQGQVLLRLDDRHWRVLERQASIELEDAERDLARWERMRESGAVAASDYDAIRRRRELAAATVEQSAVHLDQCRILSPFDGVVDAREVEVGEYVNEGQPVFQVLDLNPMKVRLDIPERDAGAVRVGDIKRVTAPSLGNVAFEARVAFVALEASPGHFTYPVELVVDAPPDGLRPGMIVDIGIQRALREGAIAVPLAAVIPRRGEHVVFVFRDGVAERRVAVLESVAGREALIGSGLEAGELLVIEGHRGLQDGVAVQVSLE